MAEFLIRLESNGAWEVGDIVHAAPNGQVWGRMETKENGFAVVEVPDMSVIEAMRWTASMPTDARPRRFGFRVTVSLAETGRLRIDSRTKFTALLRDKAPGAG